MKDFDDRINSELLDGFVTWSALEDALKGLKQEFEQPAVLLDDFNVASQHIGNLSSQELNISTADLNRSTEQHLPAVVDHTHEETGAQDLSYGNFKDLVIDFSWSVIN